MAQIVYTPNIDGDRPILVQRFPTVPIISGVAIIVLNKSTDALVSTTVGTASQSAQDDTVWLYDTADISGINLETVSFAQLCIRFRASVTGGGEIDRWQDLIINGSRINLDAKSSDLQNLILIGNALSKHNIYWDTQVYGHTYNGVKYLTSARGRAYDSKTNTDAHGATGLLYTFTLTATYTADECTSMKITDAT